MIRQRAHNLASPPRPRGFTLIEVLATLVLIALVLPVAMEGISLATSAAGSARGKAEAAALAELKLNDLITSGEWRDGAPEGDFDDFPGYHWAMEVNTRPEAQNMVELLVHVAWTSGGKERTASLGTLVYTPDTSSSSSTTGGTQP